MAYGDLGAVVDTLVYHTAASFYNDITHVVDDIYAVVLRQNTEVSLIVTFSIDNQGQISDTIIDSLNFSPKTQTNDVRIAKVTDALVAIASNDVNYEGALDTVAINPQGIITDPKIDRWIWRHASTYPRKLRHLGAGNLAVSFVSGDWNGRVYTLKVSPTGIITQTVTDTLTYLVGACEHNFLAEVHPGIWAITVRGEPDDGWMYTMSISPSGIIADTVLDTFEFDPVTCAQPTHVHVRENFHAVAHTPADGKGVLNILEISEAGAITDPAVDTYVFDTVSTVEILVYSIGQGYIGVAYKRTPTQGYLKTFYVDENGSLNNTTLDTLVFDSVTATFPHVVHVTGDVWAVAYSGSGSHGTVKTFGLETPPEPGGRKDLMMGIYR